MTTAGLFSLVAALCEIWTSAHLRQSSTQFIHMICYTVPQSRLGAYPVFRAHQRPRNTKENPFVGILRDKNDIIDAGQTQDKTQQ